jgi:hypothetical protein
VNPLDVSIEYSLGGRKVTRDEFYGGIESRIRESTVAQAQARLANVRCPTHGQTATFNRLRVSAEGFEVSLDGCCDELLGLARKALR